MPNGIIFTSVILSQVLFFIITIGLIFWFIKKHKDLRNPKEILKRRLVSGEIKEKEYDLLLKKINNKEL